MNLSAPFIKRPVATTLLAIGLAIAGIVAFFLLPVASLPQIDFPTISVQTQFPGAAPEIMATAVASPLERQIGRIAGITQMVSASYLGATTINVQFDLTRNIDGAARDIQAAINAARSQLPPNLPYNPSYRKINPADAPIIVLALTSKIYSTGQMYDVASSILQQKLSQIDGVGQVLVGGSSLPGVRIELNPTALNHYNIGLEDVRTAVATANVNQPKGYLEDGKKQARIYTNDQIFRAEQYKPIIVAFRNNAPVRVSDVADVVDSVENIRTAGLANGKPAVLLVVFKQPNANVIATVDNIQKLMPVMKAQIPNGIDIDVMVDRTATIRASLHDVEFTLIAAIILVILVVYVFLGSARSSLIPSVAVPLSLLGTFGVMYLCGYSLDNFSLMAVTISAGFVVDDAVVVLENTMRHIEAGMDAMKAALLGAKEVGFTVLSMSTSLIAVFTPILLMGGLVGRLFREFAVTLSSAILVSLLISLSVTPMMCSRFLKKPQNNTKHGTKLHRLTLSMHKHYEKGLAWALRHQLLMLLTTLAAVALSVFLAMIIPKGFFPQQDSGRIIGTIQAKQDISFQSMKQKLAEFVKIAGQDPAVQNVVGFIGGLNNPINSGTVFMALKPLSQRRISADGVINRLRDKLATVAGAVLYLQVAQDLIVGARPGNAEFQYTLSASNLQRLNAIAPTVMDQIAKIPGIVDLSSDQLSHGLQRFVTYDRDTASRFGITAQLMDNTLYDAFGQRQISNMYTLMNQYHVVMEVAPKFWQRPESLNDIWVLSPAGKAVPLSAIANFAPASTLLAVNHQNQFPAATLSFNLLPNMSIGDAVNKIEDVVRKMNLPATIQGNFQGITQAFQESLKTEPYLIIVALAAVYIVLGILYESLIHPITILSTLPSAGVGALLALLITRTELSIIALIGVILLIGIVKKNAIMMIDFALTMKREENKSSEEAIYQAALLRFRPIMMTTMAAMLGAMPLVFGFGLGAEIRRPLGIAIVGGLIMSQMLTLFTTPVIYLMLDRFGAWFLNFFPLSRWREKAEGV